MSGHGSAPAACAAQAGAPLALALLFVALAAWSWRKWSDPVIDFGLELYLPWRLVEGEVLYRDLAYRNGPLSPYWNAACFALAGVSLRTLVWVNLAVLAGITALLHGLLRRAFGPLAAFASCASFLAIFAFSQYGTVGNYNYVTPYQHGQTHGLLLGLGAIALLADALRHASHAGRSDAGGAGNLLRWSAAGLCLGALALTKAEVFVPGAAAAVVALALAAARGAGAARAAAALLVAALVPVAVATAALASAMPLADALRGVSGNALYLARALTDEAFYRRQAGLDAPGRSLLRMAASVAALAAFAAALRFGAPRIARVVRGPGARVLFALALFALVVALGGELPWQAVGRALLVTSVLACVVFTGRALRGPRGPDDARPAGDDANDTALLLSVYALALLAKLGLHPQIQHYGFALAMPAFALLVAALVGELPERLAAPGSRALARAMALSAVASLSVLALRDAQAIYAEKTWTLGTGADRMRVVRPESSPRGRMLRHLLAVLEQRLAADDTLLVLPEGATINFWLRRPNPTPWALFLPTELAAHGGEAVMLPRIEAAAPDAVVLVHRGSREFGTGAFLRDPHWGRALGEWLARDYRRVERIGSAPFRGARFGIDVLERRSAAPTP